MREMLKKKFERKLKQNSAFTLIEMLIAVAVLVVLLGISVVGVSSLKNKLELAELDAYAKNIYMEVQNQLAAMETEGSLEQIYTNLVVEGGTYYNAYNSHRLSHAPAGYDSAEYGDSYKNMYYFLMGEELTGKFVPSISMANDSNGCYLLEVNPESGDIYSVFYWKADNKTVLDYLDTYDAENIYKMLSDTTILADRSKEGRKAAQIGYYGGSITKTVTPTNYKLNQKVEIVNGEELYVKISYDLHGRMLNYVENNAGDLKIAISIHGTESDSWKKLTSYDISRDGIIDTADFNVKANLYKNETEGRLEVGFLLDSLKDGKSFSELDWNKDSSVFIPGENLQITVETQFIQDSIDITETSATYEVNSLFGDLQKDVADVNNKLYTYTISSVRHLRNLDSAYYKEDLDSKTKVRVVFDKEIDFNKGDYKFDSNGHYIGSSVRPIPEISPIKNSELFEREAAGLTKVLGDGSVIRNLVVAVPKPEPGQLATSNSYNNAGLFAYTKNVDFENIRLEDYILNAEGWTNVGALVGFCEGGSVKESGVYLMPYYRDASGVKRYYSQEQDTEYGNKMSRRYATFSVTGSENVGGLFGQVNNTDIEKCFAAVEVNGEESVGGLIGYALDIKPQNDTDVKSIRDSYASGNVRHMTDSAEVIGGFIGKAENIKVKNVYSTGNVYGANCDGNYISGFIGRSNDSDYEKCSSYGQVLNRNGVALFSAQNMHVGGMLNLSDDNTFGNCHFLKQLGYNGSAAFSDAQGEKNITDLSAGYNDFAKLESAGKVAVSFPYDGNLLHEAFPFEMVAGHHYGNWPLPYFINTSLAYYEKYENGTYGYYSVTTIEDITNAGNNSAANYIWVVDSLKDETCVEDGYALLSMYYLDNFDYKTYQVKSSSSGAPWVEHTRGNIQITNNYVEGNTKNYAVVLGQSSTLKFNAYTTTDKQNAYIADYSKETIKDTFTMSGMYLYQLPYDLQCTDRYGVYNFYDRLVIYNGKAKGNASEDAEPVIGGKEEKDGEIFFYCPHFAKTAVNPGLGTSTMDRLPNPDTIAVRSARQLNALGRMPYYWNKKGGSHPMSYEQEVDINFSTYTNYTKEYCGATFNLLAFDQPYSNQPIGDWNGDSNGYGSFQNDYNGNYHKIIDYCVKSDKQYVGLFGEIYKEGGATRSQIQNVVMVVSEDKLGNKGNYLTAATVKEQDNAGLIIGSFEDTSRKSGSNRLRAAVGALVGSDYTIGQTDGEAEVYTICNCAVSGYRVEYHINKPKNNGNQPLGIALGGMIGYSRGNIAQSTAANDVRLLINDSITGDTAAAMIGGFAGSFYYGTILNCYSGGTIDVDDNNGNYYLNRLRIAGFCPGWMDAPGVSNENNGEIVRYQNVYTYTAVSENVWYIREKKNGKYFNHFIPCIGRMKLVYEWRLFDGTKWHTDSENNNEHFVRVPGFAYYMTSIISDNIVDKSEAKEYFQNNGSKKPKTCDPARYNQLANLSWVNRNSDFKNYEGKYKPVEFQTTNLYPSLQYATYSYADNSKAYEGMSYPFPAVVKDAEGNYVHYGDWPLN